MMMKCSRCKCRTSVLFTHAVGGRRPRICPACWEQAHGRPYQHLRLPQEQKPLPGMPPPVRSRQRA